MTSTAARPDMKKLFMQMLAGALVGGVSTGAVLLAFDGRGLDPADPHQMLALVTGMIYALIGLMVGVGVAAPGAGARVLNVEDVEDLRDQRLTLGLSSAACMLIGLLFLMLAAVPAGGSGGPVTLIAGVCLIALIVLARLVKRGSDELTRQISLESSALAMQAAVFVFGGWAVLAHLGYIPWVGPLAFVAGTALLQLFAMFGVAATRGLMVPAKA